MCTSFPANTFILNKHLNQFDLLHFHDVADLSFPLSCLPSRKPKIFTCDTLQEFGKFYQHPRHNFMRKLLIRSANLFHVFSDADVRILMTLGAQKEDIARATFRSRVRARSDARASTTKNWNTSRSIILPASARNRALKNG
jgi:hypothetical protein